MGVSSSTRVAGAITRALRGNDASGQAVRYAAGAKAQLAVFHQRARSVKCWRRLFGIDLFKPLENSSDRPILEYRKKVAIAKAVSTNVSR